ncbi:hypothetical protein BCR35DRAFT_353193 [Leucosporidium creatinivorum]|uniref:F-box domain-containing protein n=1 Tax=Leucosporidium creatinivorum TaxID=106004 RepID=A0A1Y2F015_9BASI|nr:hypothetical protein BCR35DRAFT_353193 [Leucosporidium creatinivorum]
MSTTLLPRLRGALVSLWAQLDLQQGSLPSKSCRWLLEELKELKEMPVPPGYASSFHPLVEAIEKLQSTSTSSLPLIQVTYIANLLTSTITLLTAPFPPFTILDSSRPTLPSEIIFLILHQLAAQKHQSDLAASCLVSRSFLPLAREALYDTLYLEIRQTSLEEMDQFPQPTTLRRGSQFLVNYDKLSITLVRYPFLGSLVHRLVVHTDNDSAPVVLQPMFDDVLSLLKSCQPRHIHFYVGAATDAAVEVVWQSGQLYQSIELEEIANNDQSRLWEVLEEQTELKNLSLRSYGDGLASPIITFTSRLVQLNLHLLNLTEPTEGVAPLFESLTSYSSSTLVQVDLTLYFEDQSWHWHDLFCDLRVLRSLTLRLFPPTHSTDQLKQQQERHQLQLLLSRIPSTVTSLSFLGSPNSRTYFIDLGNLPPSITHLNITAFNLSPSTLLSLLRSSSTLQNLTQLQYHSSSFNNGETQTETEIPLPWNPTTRANVAAVLDELGILGNPPP